MEAEVFPVEAQATAVAPARTAWVTATVMPRSLKEPVGFSPSCLRARSSWPTHAATASRR